MAILWPNLRALFESRDSGAGSLTLRKAFVIVPLVGWAGVAALVHYTRLPFPQKANEGTVVIVPARTEQVAHVPAPAQPPRVIPPAGNRAALVRELQKELIRVGCYDGEISGVWTTSSRRAMRDFTDRVNARLPIDEPDLILLSLVQGHRQKACGIACPAGQQEGAGGRCVPNALATRATQQPAAPDVRPDSKPERSPVIIGSTTTAAAVAAAMSRPERSAAASEKPAARILPPPADGESQQGSAARNAPVPSQGAYERRRSHQAARRAKSRPPAVVRKLVRSVKNALSSLGIQ